MSDRPEKNRDGRAKRYKIDEYAYNRLQSWAPEMAIKIGDSFTIEEFECVKSEVLVKYGYPPLRLKLNTEMMLIQPAILISTTLKVGT